MSVNITRTYKCIFYTKCYEIATFFAFLSSGRGAQRRIFAESDAQSGDTEKREKIRFLHYVNRTSDIPGLLARDGNIGIREKRKFR